MLKHLRATQHQILSEAFRFLMRKMRDDLFAILAVYYLHFCFGVQFKKLKVFNLLKFLILNINLRKYASNETSPSAFGKKATASSLCKEGNAASTTYEDIVATEEKV